ncbi:hypothetical protein J3Q64DRAFT_1699034 [Phycomyces blakesleeanus]
MSFSSFSLPTTPNSDEERHLFRQEIAELMYKRVIENEPKKSPGFTSPMFVIPKQNGFSDISESLGRLPLYTGSRTITELPPVQAGGFDIPFQGISFRLICSPLVIYKDYLTNSRGSLQTGDQNPVAVKEPDLKIRCIQDLGHKYEEIGLSEEALNLLIEGSLTNTPTNRVYQRGQHLFITWALQHDVFPTEFFAQDLHQLFPPRVHLSPPLSQKSAFLLAMATFLRPSDFSKLRLFSATVNFTSGALTFDVLAPKETASLCPVRTFCALRDNPKAQFAHKRHFSSKSTNQAEQYRLLQFLLELEIRYPVGISDENGDEFSDVNEPTEN